MYVKTKIVNNKKIARSYSMLFGDLYVNRTKLIEVLPSLILWLIKRTNTNY